MISIAAVTSNPALAKPPPAGTLPEDRCQRLLDLAYDEEAPIDSWGDALNCAVNDLRDAIGPSAGTGAAAPMVTAQWCEVEQTRLTNRLTQVGEVAARYGSDAAYGTPVPIEIQQLQQELRASLDRLRRTCTAQPPSEVDGLPDVGATVELLDRLEAALDGHTGHVSAAAWCRLYEARGEIKVLTEGSAGVSELRNMLAAWPSGCPASDAYLSTYPLFVSALEEAQRQLDGQSTAMVSLEIGPPSLEASTLGEGGRWWLDGSEVDGAGTRRLDVKPGRHRVSHRHSINETYHSMLVDIEPGEVIAICFDSEAGQFLSGTRCRQVLDERQTEAGWPVVSPMTSEAPPARLPFGVAIDLGVGAALGENLREAGASGGVALHTTAGWMADDRRVGPALDVMVGRTSRPLEIRRIGGGSASAGSSNVELGPAILADLWNRHSWSSTAWLALRWSIPYDQLGTEIGGTWWWLGTGNRRSELPVGISLAIGAPGLSVLAPRIGLCLGTRAAADRDWRKSQEGGRDEL